MRSLLTASVLFSTFLLVSANPDFALSQASPAASPGVNNAVPSDTAYFNGEGGFQDLLLPISRYRCTEDGACLIEARGLYGGVEIGLRARIAGGMKEGFVGDTVNEEAFLEDGVELQSLGEPTRALAYALSRAYGVKFKSETLRGSISLTSIPLEGTPKKIESEPLKLKVFHDPKEEEGLYFELYLNIDLKKKTLELAEKDEEYRQSILRTFLSAPKPKAPEKKPEAERNPDAPLTPIERLEKSVAGRLPTPANPEKVQ